MTQETATQIVERWRADGREPSPELLAKAEQEREQAARIAEARAKVEASLEARKAERQAEEARKAEAVVERAEAAAKAEALAAWRESGGSAADFEAEWPKLKAEVIRARTVRKLTGGGEGGRLKVEL